MWELAPFECKKPHSDNAVSQDLGRRSLLLKLRCIMLGMKWKADRTTIVAAFASVAAGWARIAFAHDLVLGGAMIGVGIALAVRTFFYFRSN
jgi:hypothetical protein